MCRISGILDINAVETFDIRAVGAGMRDSLAYGGPDDHGEYIDPTTRLYLGHRRLAVIDVSPAGHQPMFMKDLVIVFNGEIYNYAAVSQELVEKGYQFKTGSDTEVILKAFEYWGYDAVGHFRGMFAFAIWNKTTRKLTLCRDRVGVKPLYWYFKDGIFLFGSELKSFCKLPGFDKTIDQAAVSLFLQTGYIKAPYSIYQFARKINPGSFLEIDMAGTIKEWKYWDLHDIKLTDEFSGTDEEAVLEKGESILKESCDLRMVADVPVGIFLSGGLDSSLVTALLQKDNPKPLKTFTIGFEHKDFDESSHARAVAKHLGTDHHEMICKENDFVEVLALLPDMYDEPFGDSSAIPTHLVARMARQEVTVALSADGGDEVFAGYLRYKAIPDIYDRIKNLPFWARKLIASFLARRDFKTTEKIFNFFSIPYNFKSLEWRLPKLVNALNASSDIEFFELSSLGIQPGMLADLHRSERQSIFSTDFEREKNGLYSFLAKVDISSYLEGDILAKVDRATMRVALEGREPLLDHKVIEFGLSLPDQFKIRNGQTKWVLRNVLYKYVPKELIERPKQGFGIPVKAWLSTILMQEIQQIPGDRQFIALFQLDAARIDGMIQAFEKQKNMSINPQFIWYLYCLHKWYQAWIK